MIIESLLIATTTTFFLVFGIMMLPSIKKKLEEAGL